MRSPSPPRRLTSSRPRSGRLPRICSTRMRSRSACGPCWPRTRPFKAPADHEPVIPEETTLVIAVVGADVFGQPLDGEHVHRPERVSALSGAAPGSPVTPELVARVLTHPEGGRKGVPPGARLAVLINKMDAVPDPSPARETAALLIREPAIHVVVLAAVRGPDPALEVYRR